MKDKFHIAVTGAGTMLAKAFVNLLNSLGHHAIAVNAADIGSASSPLPSLPQLIVIAVTKQNKSDIETIESIKKFYPGIPVMIVVMSTDINDVIRGIKAGVHGYVLTTIDPEELNNAVKTVAGNHDYFFDLTNERLIYSDKNDINNPYKVNAAMHFSHRFRQYLQLLSAELSYDEIALTMQIAPRTGQGYRAAISSMLKIKSRVGLVLFAVKNNLVNTE